MVERVSFSCGYLSHTSPALDSLDTNLCEHRLALLAGGTVDISDEDLSSALNLMKEAEGCVPQEEVDADPLTPIRRKFAAVYQTAMEMAEAELAKKGLKDGKHFNFCLEGGRFLRRTARALYFSTTVLSLSSDGVRRMSVPS